MAAIIIPGRRQRRPVGYTVPVADPTLGFAFNFDHFDARFTQAHATYRTQLYQGTLGPGYGALGLASNSHFYAGVRLIEEAAVPPPYRLGGAVTNSTCLWFGELQRLPGSAGSTSIFNRDHGTYAGVWKIRTDAENRPEATVYLNSTNNVLSGTTPLELFRPYLIALTTTNDSFILSVDGETVATFYGTPVTNPSNYAQRIIREGKSTASNDGHWGRISYAVAWFDRAILGEELKELAENPWQLFRAEPVRIYSLPSGAITLNSLTASNITSSGARITLGLTR